MLSRSDSLEKRVKFYLETASLENECLIPAIKKRNGGYYQICFLNKYCTEFDGKNICVSCFSI